MGNRLYVGNLSFHTGEQTLRDAFSECGEVADLRIVTDRETGRSRGFAFVTMSDARGASQAISQMNGAMVDGRDLRVNEAEERSNGGGGGRSGGRGFGGGGGGGGYGGGGDRGFGGGRGRSF